MKTKVSILAALFLLNLDLSTCFSQGTLSPPGPPTPTMKSLDQIEARTAITNMASTVTISQPGSYYLTHNLAVTAGDAIDINANGVTLDLNGFTISSTAAVGVTSGISLNDGLSDITIWNGHIRGGVTNNGSGVYSGNGFHFGIRSDLKDGPVNVLVSGVSVSGCLSSGILLGVGDSTMVESCTVRTVGGGAGINAAMVKDCSVIDCGFNGILGDQVSDCRGESSGSGSGISASFSATACYGYSTSGTGLSALIANGCHGATSNGIALSATHNVNSF
jgi:hypothetical protein